MARTAATKRITVHDRGPRSYDLEGYQVQGTYALSNLFPCQKFYFLAKIR